MDRFKALGHRVANRLFKHTVWPVGGRRFGQNAEQTAKNNVQQQVSGNPHPPHGGNARGLPVFGRLTEPNASHNFFVSPTFLFCWISIWGKLRLDNKRLEIKQKRIERESEKARQDNARQMSVEWSSMHLSREAVLKKRNKSNRFSILRKLLRWVKKWKADKTTRAPTSVASIIQFFIRWKNRRDDDTIDSARLKEYIGSRFDTFHDILTEIRDDEARDWGGADVNKLNKVIDFLDKISKMEMDG